VTILHGVKRSIAVALCLGGAAMLVAAAGGIGVQRTAAPVVAPIDFALTGELTQGGWARGRMPAGAAALTLDGKPVPVAADGSFFLAFDRDAQASATLSARLADGRVATRALTVAPRAWKLEYIPIGPRPGGTPSEAFARRRAAELVRINAARALDTHSQGWRQRFVWPVHGRISGLFGSQRIYNGTPGSYHTGTDIATGASGTPFVAPADGVVILAADSPFTLEGNLLMIDHGMGLNSAFLHCSEILVHEGEAVKQGQVIGRIGKTGRATGPHLHWSIKWRDARLDPILFTGPMG
jgi:murein DD-endopeptidase MepM/ murein hydrolase activator NlpD